MATSADIRLLADAIISALPKEDKILTDSQMATILDRPIGEVQKMCRKEILHATKFKGKWYIRESQLKADLFGD